MSRREKMETILFGPILCLPKVPIIVFLSSILLSFILTLIFSVIGDPILMDIFRKLHNPKLNEITSSVFLDPMTWHFFISLICGVLILIGAKYVKGADNWSRIIAALLPLFILISMLIIGDYLIKPAFNIERPPDPLPEPPLTSFIESSMDKLLITFMDDLSSDSGNSMPSGFVMRQIGQFLFLEWILINSEIKKWLKYFIHFVNVFGLILVIFSRIYRGAHTPLDVSAAISVGTILFWLLVLPPLSLISVRGFRIHSIHLSTLSAATMLVFFVLLGFSNNASGLLRIFALTIILLGIIYNIPPPFKLRVIKFGPRSYQQIKIQRNEI